MVSCVGHVYVVVFVILRSVFAKAGCLWSIVVPSTDVYVVVVSAVVVDVVVVVLWGGEVYGKLYFPCVVV